MSLKILFIFLVAFVLIACQTNSPSMTQAPEETSPQYPIAAEKTQPSMPEVVMPEPTPVVAMPAPQPLEPPTYTPPPLPPPLPEPEKPKVSEAIPVKPVEAPVKPKEEPKPIAPAKKYYHLRIISYEYHPYYQEEANKIQKFLKKEHSLEADVREASNKKGDKYWVVDVGKFESENAPEAKEFAKKVKGIQYQRGKQFHDAFFVQY